ncbi:MAG: hypothetical protein EON54_17415 [Alcaligenaceae bacterium]|nr:MAG: hypothetical protein EON54_17415 [Alcaligenaceae bacterium]
MSSPEKKLPPLLSRSKQEDCLRELKDAGGKPWHLIVYGWLNFAMPSMFNRLCGAIVVLGMFYIGAVHK